MGFIIGVLQSLIYVFLREINWSIYASVPICLAAGYLITGGLHIDGLMDTFDGIFAGPKKRFKAMKDSKVGSYGVQSLFFITLIQIACLLKIKDQIIYILPICLFWGRFSTLIYIENYKYITYKKKSVSHKKNWKGLKNESLVSLVFLTALIFYYLITYESNETLIKNLLITLSGLFISYKIPKILGNIIGGFNGDSCGASVVIVETIILFIYSILL